MELRELFTLDDPRFSKTQRQLEELHANQRKTDTLLDEHIAYLHSLDIFGISDHDLMFTQAKIRDDEEDDMIGIGEEEEQNNARLIQHRVHNAQKLIAEESTIPISYEERSRGVMRFPLAGAATYTAPSSGGPVPIPSGTAPRPSPLFTQVPHPPATANQADEDDHSVMEVSNNSAIIEASDNPVPEVVDLTVADSDDAPVKKEVLSVKGTPDSPVKATKERRVLQPLSSEEVRHRSPQVTQTSKKGEIIAEELLISPDNRSPIIGLEKVHTHRRMMEEAARTGSFPSSPVRALASSPKSHTGRGIMSPSKLAASPIRGLLGPNRHPSPRASPLRRSLFPGATSTPQTKSDADRAEILVEESPDSRPQTPTSSSTRYFGNVSSSFQSQPLDISQACRKLSFVVADSAKNSPADSDHNAVKSLQSSPCPVAKKKSKPGSSPARQESFTASQLQSEDSNVASLNTSSVTSSAIQNSPTQDSRTKASRSLLAAFSNSARTPSQSHLSSPNKLSLAGGLQNNSPYKATTKRRSVCIRKTVIDDDSSDDSDDKKEDRALSSDGEDNDENENVDEIVIGNEESDEDDKENDPVLMRRLGGRNRLVSESGSESGSCFEVEESEEEVEEIQTETDREEEKSAAEERQLEGADCEAGATGVTEDAADAETDEELNQRFQSLILIARRMYKEKNYVDSLQHVEEALKIFYEPELKKMADKIQLKLETMD